MDYPACLSGPLPAQIPAAISTSIPTSANVHDSRSAGPNDRGWNRCVSRVDARNISTNDTRKLNQWWSLPMPHVQLDTVGCMGAIAEGSYTNTPTMLCATIIPTPMQTQPSGGTVLFRWSTIDLNCTGHSFLLSADSSKARYFFSISRRRFISAMQGRYLAHPSRSIAPVNNNCWRAPQLVPGGFSSMHLTPSLPESS